MAYITTAELKEYLGIDGAGDDSLLDGIIDNAKGIIDRYCNRTFEATADTTRYFDAIYDVDGQYLVLDGDLSAITTLTNGDGAVLTTASYVTEPRNTTPYHRVRLKSASGKAWTYTTDHEGAISIAGKWSYSVTPPDDIVHVCTRLAGYIYHQKDNAGELDRAVIAGNATILPVQLPGDIRLMLAPYRKVTK